VVVLSQSREFSTKGRPRVSRLDRKANLIANNGEDWKSVYIMSAPIYVCSVLDPSSYFPQVRQS
jgi:hypothetical protein